MWFSKGHFHFIIGLPEAQPNYKRSFHPSTKKRQNGEWITQKALHDLPPAIRPLILISWDGMGHFQRGGGGGIFLGVLFLDPFDDPVTLMPNKCIFISLFLGIRVVGAS